MIRESLFQYIAPLVKSEYVSLIDFRDLGPCRLYLAVVGRAEDFPGERSQTQHVTYPWPSSDQNAMSLLAAPSRGA